MSRDMTKPRASEVSSQPIKWSEKWLKHEISMEITSDRQGMKPRPLGIRYKIVVHYKFTFKDFIVKLP